MFLTWSWTNTIIHPIWPPEPLIGWADFNSFSNMAGHDLMKLGNNVPCEVLIRCCLFGSDLSFFALQILIVQDFFDMSNMAGQNLMKRGGNTPSGVLSKCCYLVNDQSSNMAALESDWHIWLFKRWFSSKIDLIKAFVTMLGSQTETLNLNCCVKKFIVCSSMINEWHVIFNWYICEYACYNCKLPISLGWALWLMDLLLI